MENVMEYRSKAVGDVGHDASMTTGGGWQGLAARSRLLRLGRRWQLQLAQSVPRFRVASVVRLVDPLRTMKYSDAVFLAISYNKSYESKMHIININEYKLCVIHKYILFPQISHFAKEKSSQYKHFWQYPPITYYWPGLLILDHSYPVGNLTNSKTAETKGLEPLILTLLYQQFSNLLTSQRDMSGPRLGALFNNR
jgi:hypothetical protein